MHLTLLFFNNLVVFCYSHSSCCFLLKQILWEVWHIELQSFKFEEVMKKRIYGVSIFGDILKPSGHGSGKLPLGGPT